MNLPRDFPFSELLGDRRLHLSLIPASSLVPSVASLLGSCYKITFLGSAPAQGATVFLG